jgi:hypothetical protein
VVPPPSIPFTISALSSSSFLSMIDPFFQTLLCLRRRARRSYEGWNYLWVNGVSLD